MSIITWNCQGASDKRFPPVFKSLVTNHNPDIFVLVEPRVSGATADKVIKKLRFPNSHRVEASGYSGGIWVLWSDKVHAEILLNHFQFVHMRIHHHARNVSFFFTAVYGSPQARYRKFLWDDLSFVSPPPGSAWLLAGDFNAITSAADRCGGAHRRTYGCPAFISFINNNGLLDLGFSGSKYTWRRGTLFVRLDRALATTSWLTLFPHSSVHHLAQVLSDHRPLQLSLGSHERAPPSERPFKFLAAWLTHPSFPDLVRRGWRVGDTVLNNINRFTLAAKTWNFEVFGGIGKRKRRTLARLQGVQRSLEVSPSSDFLNTLEQSLREDYEETCMQEELLWIQKSCADWMCLGDKNTSYYHTKATMRRRRNHISSLKNDLGILVTDEGELSDMASNYFCSLYSSDGPAATHLAISGAFPDLVEDELLPLTSDIIEAEVKQALFEMKPLKSPGLDGLHALFFQSQWGIVGPDVVSFIQQLWHGAPLNPEINQTLIALIPKVQNPTQLKDLRPISLCTVLYKLVTKVVANRLRTILPKLISQHQTSFVHGRSILENIIITQEVVHSMRTKQGAGGWMAIKIDLEKAFDRLKWEFIEDTLFNANLPPRLVRLIMSCLTTSSMQVLWNGKASQSFQPQRGVRQGDPLSPYLFVLCMERLSQMITAAVRQGSWKAIRMGRRGVPLSHLFFADDLIIFCKAELDQIEVVQKILSDFCAASGHKVSNSKTKIFFSRNVSLGLRSVISGQFQYEQADGLGRYLGVPLLTGRMSSSIYRYILDRIRAKLAGWKQQSLSLAGRITLAKSVLQSIPFYTMQSILLPLVCCRNIEKEIRKFVWGHTREAKKVNLVKWSELCQPLAHGGVGLLKLDSQNKSFMTKLAFQIHSQPDSLWVRILKGKYGAHDTLTFPRNSSAFWRQLGQLWHEASLHIKWHPGDGTHLCFWKDFWVGELGPLKHLAYAPLDDQTLEQPISHYVDHDGAWKLALFQHLLPPSLVEEIKAIKILDSAGPPSCYWHLNSNGSFSTRSAYKSLEAINWDKPEKKWVKLWKLPMAQRVKTFAWLFFKNRLLTNAERHRRHMATSDQCSLCDGSREDLEHALKHCSLAAGVWKEILPPDIYHQFSTTSLQPWLHSLLLHPTCHISWQIGCFIICWKLWQARNLRLFTAQTLTVHGVISHIRSIINTTLHSFAALHLIL